MAVGVVDTEAAAEAVDTKVVEAVVTKKTVGNLK